MSITLVLSTGDTNLKVINSNDIHFGVALPPALRLRKRNEMETLVWILQAVPHAIFITGLIVAGHWSIKKIIKAVKEYDNV